MPKSLVYSKSHQTQHGKNLRRKTRCSMSRRRPSGPTEPALVEDGVGSDFVRSLLLSLIERNATTTKGIVITAGLLGSARGLALSRDLRNNSGLTSSKFLSCNIAPDASPDLGRFIAFCPSITDCSVWLQNCDNRLHVLHEIYTAVSVNEGIQQIEADFSTAKR